MDLFSQFEVALENREFPLAREVLHQIRLNWYTISPRIHTQGEYLADASARLKEGREVALEG
jgi:hypothetical protein